MGRKEKYIRESTSIKSRNVIKRYRGPGDLTEWKRKAVCVIRLTEIQKNVDDRCERNNS